MSNKPLRVAISAMITAARGGSSKRVLEVRDIRKLARQA